MLRPFRHAMTRAPSYVLLTLLPGILALTGGRISTASLLLVSAPIAVTPADNIQALVDRNPPGTSFRISPGIYRLQTIVPKNGDSFTGEPGAILNGAQVLNSFTRQGSLWVTHVEVRPPANPRGICRTGNPACALPEDLFIDNAPLRRVAALGDVASGKWYLDYGTGSAYLADDPQGHIVEISMAQHAFQGSAGDVTIRGLVIEKYANPAQTGAINGFGEGGRLSQNWVVEQNEIRLNHGTGLRTGNRMRVLKNNVHHNGQMGLAGSGDNLLIEGNEIAYNNYAGYSWGWEGGGTKFVYTRNLVVRNNFVHHNQGPGLWTDTDNDHVLYEHNRTSSNIMAGIDHEISFDAVIRDNTIENDGYNPDGSGISWGAGIFIYASSNVEVYRNTLINCMHGIVARQDDRGFSRSGIRYLVKNLYVHDNLIKQAGGFALGLRKSGPFDDSVFTSWNNRFENNHCELTDPKAKYFHWLNRELTQQEWDALRNRR